jgi:hypothetical protein
VLNCIRFRLSDVSLHCTGFRHRNDMMNLTAGPHVQIPVIPMAFSSGLILLLLRVGELEEYIYSVYT